MEEDQDKPNENHERDVSYNPKLKSDIPKEEKSIDTKNNQLEEEAKEK